MNEYSKMPCFRFYGAKEDDGERIKRIEYALLNMLKRNGVTDVNMATMEVYRSINPVLSGTVDTIECERIFQAADPKSEFACAAYWKEELGIDVHVVHGDFCRICPAGEEGGSNQFHLEQERHMISYLCHGPAEDLISFFQGESPFCSYEELNRHFNGKLKFPCVVQLASIIYRCLADEYSLYQKICDSLENEKFLSRAVSELSERVLAVIAKLYSTGDIAVLQSEAFREILASYIKDFYISCEPATGTQFDMFCAMMRGTTDETEPLDPLKEQEIIDFLQDDFMERDAEAVDPACEEQDETAQMDSTSEQRVQEGVPDWEYRAKHDKLECAEETMDADKRYKEHTSNESSLEQEETAETEENLALVQESYGKLEEHPYFVRKVKIGDGGWLGNNEPVEFVPAAKRRYLIPFAQNDSTPSISRKNMIVHQELNAGDLEAMLDVTDIEDQKVMKELSFLSEKAHKDKRMAVEIVYVTDEERYILLIWNAGTTRYNYVNLIEKADGLVKAIPIQIIRLLRAEDIKIICYQSYMLCGVLGLYSRDIEVKNIHSIYSHYCVFSRNGKGAGTNAQMADIIKQYLIGLNDKDQKTVEVVDRRFGKKAFLLWQMPLYDMILRQQFAYAEMMGMEGLCASQQKKDIMYGYSYLAAGIYPSMQKARFSLLSNGEIVFHDAVEPAVSYEPGYIVEFTFRNIDFVGSDETMAENVRSNHRARQLLLKEIAKKTPAFYHAHLKILYFDDYRITFYMSHDYRDDNQRVIEQSLYRECTRYRVSSNKLLASYWATTFNTVRIVNRH